MKISKKLISTMAKTIVDYNLIKEDDNILVGLSGGKDSLCLVHALNSLQKYSPVKFSFKAVTISYGMGENFDYLKAHLKEHSIDYEVHETNIFSLAKEKIRSNSSFCSFFSRMRRGALYTYAQNNNYKKLALAHHLDDATESFFMNFMHNGALRTMPISYTSKYDIDVIRPLIFVRERQLVEQAKEFGIPLATDENCPAMRFDVKMPVARAKTKDMLKKMEEENSDLFVSLKKAFTNIHIDTFYDKDHK